MSTEVVVALIVLVGGGLTTLVNYLISKRNSSGSISTSDAASLWKESNDLRQEYRKRAEDLEAQLKLVNDKLQSVLDELSKVRLNSASLLEKIAELKTIISELRDENKRLLALREGVMS